MSSTVHRYLFTNSFLEGGYIFFFGYFHINTLNWSYSWLKARCNTEGTNESRQRSEPRSPAERNVFDFAIVYPDPRAPVYRLREIGTTCAGHKGQDDGVSLANKKFVIGDFLDIAISPPRNERPNQRRNRPPYWSSRWSHVHHLSLVSDRGVLFFVPSFYV